MKPKLKYLYIFIIITTMIVPFYSCGKKSNPQEKKKKKEEIGTPVEAVKVTRGSITAVYTGSTTLETEEEAEVVAKVSGVVKKIYVEEGDQIKAGQILAKLDDEQYKLELAQAKSRLEKLSNDFQRNQELYKKNIVSKEAFERTKFEFQTQKSTFDLAKLKQNYTSIEAPISGIISKRFIKVGNMVNLNKSTFRITNFNPLLAVLHIPEKEMSKLKVGFPATITADALQDSTYQGKVLRISPVVDAGTGTFKVTVEINDKTRKLKPGMFTRIQVVYDTHENTLLIPKNAVLSEDQESSVFVVQKGKVSKKEVQTGFQNSNFIEILSGINLGDTIVTTGLGGLKEGSKVKIVE